MNLIFTMSISGSLVFLLYLLAKPIQNRVLAMRQQYLLLKIVLLFFLIPFQCLQAEYRALCDLLLKSGRTIDALGANSLIFKPENTVFISIDGKMHFKYAGLLLVIAVLWLGSVSIFLYRQIKKYGFCRKTLLFLSETFDTEKEQILTDNNKRPQILICPFIKAPFTIGLIKPLIILPKEGSSEDRFLYLSHELCHIKNHDILWKCMAFAAILIHWYNPLVYILFREICSLGEKTCDELVIDTLSESQRQHYEQLIISAAQEHTAINILFADTFSSYRKQTTARIMALITERPRRSARQKTVIAILLGLFVLSMPISVLAYEPLHFYESNMPYTSNDSTVWYTFGEDAQDPFYVLEDHIDFSTSDNLLFDESGNIYIFAENDAAAAAVCNHSYIDGVRRYHQPNGSGCTVYVYTGTYCTKCGYTLTETLTGQYTYNPCPH